MRARGFLALLVVLAALAGGAYYAHLRLKAAAGTAQPVYATAKVTAGPLVADVLGFGPLQPDFLASLQSPTSGTVQQVLVQEGDTVKKGQVLAVLTNPNIANTVQDDEVSLQKDLQALATALDTTPAAAMQVANANSGVPVPAPQTGRVVKWSVQVGQNVAAGDELAQIVDDSQVVMDVGLVPYDYQRAAVGDTVSVQFDNFDAEPDPRRDRLHLPRGDHPGQPGAARPRDAGHGGHPRQGRRPAPALRGHDHRLRPVLGDQ